jgi:hypothetical protein
VRWLDETTKTAQKGWVGCGIAQGFRFYSLEARGNKEITKMRGGFDSPNRRRKREGGAEPEEEERKGEKSH